MVEQSSYSYADFWGLQQVNYTTAFNWVSPQMESGMY